MLFESALIACIRHISSKFLMFLHEISHLFLQNILNVFSAKKERIGFQTHCIFILMRNRIRPYDKDPTGSGSGSKHWVSHQLPYL